MSKLDTPLAKIAIPLLVFVAIFGGWRGVQYFQRATATLPDAQPSDGACTLWFVGSSSIHRWTSLDRDMAPWKVHNRGINSATLADIIPRFRNIRPAREGRPQAIILYVGENDIAGGVPVRTVVRELARLLDLRTRLLGDVPVLLLSAKPSPGRAAFLPDQRLFNLAAQRLIPHAPNVHYVDITTPLLVNGRMGDNYQPDGVHMNPQGYRIWAKVVRARLKDILPAATVNRCAPGS
ncbi:GDSL-type esterase/lipase family protein [Sphingobium sp.]|uniref:GDSL-type esterase/lipase family protein n=1 Tax=Sphingobium sp. TaxID=1912891 RepID=UPI002C2541E9|nr:GDSL-type esterase/lipase family protein [Sphingobium sp.]HUD91994.1 GDSL-type esterase/lipase family protein [Sphingobium sp.]